MSSVPGAPIPLAGPPSPPSNPWTRFAIIGGSMFVLVGVVVLIVGSTDQNYYAASPLPLVAGALVFAFGVLLFLCAFALAGVEWYLRHPREEVVSDA